MDYNNHVIFSAAMATDSVIDLVLFSSDDDNLVAMASYHDRTLRLFSCQVSTNILKCYMLLVTIATEGYNDILLVRLHQW